MKRYSLISLPILLLAFIFTSCDQENIKTIYNDGGTPKVSFASKVLVKSMAPADQNVIKVPIYRTSNTGTSPVVNLSFKTTSTNAKGLFTLPDSAVVFESGSDVAYAQIKYSDINKLGATSTYGMSLTIKDSTVLSPTKTNIITITASRQLTFADFGTGKFTSKFFGQSWDQPIQKAVEGEVYKLIDCYATGYPIVFAVNSDNSVTFTLQQTGYVDTTYGMVSLNPLLSTGAVVPGSLKVDKTITLAARFSVSAGSWGPYTETLVLP